MTAYSPGFMHLPKTDALRSRAEVNLAAHLKVKITKRTQNATRPSPRNLMEGAGKGPAFSGFRSCFCFHARYAD